jgi:hypothetical protein
MQLASRQQFGETRGDVNVTKQHTSLEVANLIGSTLGRVNEAACLGVDAVGSLGKDPDGAMITCSRNVLVSYESKSG